MKSQSNTILSINGGSSGIKFAMYEAGDLLKLLFSGEIESGGKNNSFQIIDAGTLEKSSIQIAATDRLGAIDLLIAQLERKDQFKNITMIGHRIVHGMKQTESQLITDELLTALKNISGYDPEHLPGEIKLIEAFAKRFPAIPQVACFDTAFHHTMPPVAKLMALPRWLYEKGIQRYGFHGLSYEFLLQELERIAGKETAAGKIILAHLGNGASLAAVKAGKSIDTSMGFTPASGIPMGTRCGDLDPGVAWYLMQFENLTAKGFSQLINHESGLLGISETSADMRELLKIQHTDSRAAEAIELFCYQTKKWVGSFAAVLGGLETLVFSGGIGEHSPEVRRQICEGLQFLGIELDETKNVNNDAVISSDASKVCVRVIPTNEALMIAGTAWSVLKKLNRK
ncbi:MAG: acetate/propionate family kinase [Ferruginibacter sp.]